MSTAPPPIIDLPPPAGSPAVDLGTSSRGFWSEAWRRFRRRKLAMVGLGFVVFMTLVAIFAPLIVGTRPIVCKFKGEVYFPFLGYYYEPWENAIFKARPFRGIYPNALKKADPDSWAIWPLIYQDPARRIREGEWEGRPENPLGAEGAPSRHNLFGTNTEGIDLFAQLIHGTKISLLVGFISTGIAAAIGIPLGALAGYLGGWADLILSRILEVVLCVPPLVLILALIAILERPTIWHVMVVLGLTQWTTIARLARGEFLRLREGEFVTAARALGVGHRRIIFRHILPNAMAPIMVPITFGIAAAILIESALSFLGFGSPPDRPSWGTLLNAGRSNLDLWWLIVFPGLAIFFSVLSYNLIGEGLQEATDPRLREAGK